MVLLINPGPSARVDFFSLKRIPVTFSKSNNGVLCLIISILWMMILGGATKAYAQEEYAWVLVEEKTMTKKKDLNDGMLWHLQISIPRIQIRPEGWGDTRHLGIPMAWQQLV